MYQKMCINIPSVYKKKSIYSEKIWPKNSVFPKLVNTVNTVIYLSNIILCQSYLSFNIDNGITG